jgi:tetratricopeptide (TPR) repeat protein
MIRSFIVALIAVATSVPTFAEELPRGQLAALATSNNRMLAADHSAAQTHAPAALDLYRRGLAHARMGDAEQAFGNFNEALELEPDLTLAY